MVDRDANGTADAARPTWHGRLQRRLRRQRRNAGRDAVIGLVVAAAIVLGSGYVELATAEEPNPPGGDDPLFSAAMVGDIMTGRHVEEVVDQHGYASLFAPTEALLEADYVSGNLEQVITEDPDELPEADKFIHLSDGPEMLDALAAAGFTTVTLANNHTMDHGIPGLEETIAAVDEAGLDRAGAGLDLAEAQQPAVTQHEDLTVATLSFTDAYVEGFPARAFQGGVLTAEPDAVESLIEETDAEADLTIAQFHWGEEYDLGPSADQRELAEVAADAGADLIVGHHPHVLMPVERIGDALVLYSLGNFVFDQGWSRTRESAVARYELDPDGTARVVLVPALVREATPTPLSGPWSAYRRARIGQQLRGEGLDWERDGTAFVAEIDHHHVLEDDDG